MILDSIAKHGRRNLFCKRSNVWQYAIGGYVATKDRIAYEHPAIFPEKLAEDHIISWSNPNDIIFDPMCGSGTTCAMASKLGRRYIGCDISEKYVEIARKRVEKYSKQTRLAGFE